MAKLNKVAGAEESCPSCHNGMVCVEIPANGNYPSRLQWQTGGKAHYSFDASTKTTSCKSDGETATGKITSVKATSPEQKLENMTAFSELGHTIAMTMSSKFIDTIKGKLDADSEIDIQEKQIDAYLAWIKALSNVFNC
jgi:hypothetical protein